MTFAWKRSRRRHGSRMTTQRSRATMHAPTPSPVLNTLNIPCTEVEDCLLYRWQQLQRPQLIRHRTSSALFLGQSATIWCALRMLVTRMRPATLIWPEHTSCQKHDDAATVMSFTLFLGQSATIWCALRTLATRTQPETMIWPERTSCQKHDDAATVMSFALFLGQSATIWCALRTLMTRTQPETLIWPERISCQKHDDAATVSTLDDGTSCTAWTFKDHVSFSTYLKISL